MLWSSLAAGGLIRIINSCVLRIGCVTSTHTIQSHARAHTQNKHKREQSSSNSPNDLCKSQGRHRIMISVLQLNAAVVKYTPRLLIIICSSRISLPSLTPLRACVFARPLCVCIYTSHANGTHIRLLFRYFASPRSYLCANK